MDIIPFLPPKVKDFPAIFTENSRNCKNTADSAEGFGSWKRKNRTKAPEIYRTQGIFGLRFMKEASSLSV